MTRSPARLATQQQLLTAARHISIGTESPAAALAQALLSRALDNCSPETSSQCWQGCALLSALLQQPDEPLDCARLTQLTDACRVTLLELFDSLQTWCEVSDSPKHVTQLIQSSCVAFNVSMCIYRNHARAFEYVFPREQGALYSGQLRVTRRQLHTLSWLIFVNLKCRLPMSVAVDVVSQYYVMLCTVDIVYAAALHSAVSPLLNTALPKYAVDTNSVLPALCHTLGGDELQAKHVRTHVWLPAFDGLLADVNVGYEPNALVQHAQHICDILITSANYTYLNDPEVRPKLRLEAEVKSLLLVAESCFVAGAEPPGPEEADMQQTVKHLAHMCINKVNSDRRQERSQPRGHHKSYVISDDQLCSASAQPNQPPLTVHLRALTCPFADAADVKAEAARRWQRRSPAYVSRIEAAVDNCQQMITDYAGNSEPTATDDVAALLPAIRQLFWSFALSFTEKRKLDDKEPLLDEVFLRSVYVAAIEVVFFCHQIDRRFPWSANALKMCCFDFYKIIELLVRRQPNLSRAMVVHLNEIEESVLDRFAWHDGSTLWTAVVDSELMPEARSVCRSTGSTTGRSPNTPDKRPCQDNAENTYLSSDLFPRNAALCLFYRKVYALARQRVHRLCRALAAGQTNNSFFFRVLRLFEQVLVDHMMLLQNRRLDQIIICTVYIMLKATGSAQSFSDLLAAYRSQTRANSDVYRCVFLQISDETVEPVSTGHQCDGTSLLSAPTDIVCFYNSVFAPALQHSALVIAQSHAAAISLPSASRLQLRRSLSQSLTVRTLSSVDPTAANSLPAASASVGELATEVIQPPREKHWEIVVGQGGQQQVQSNGDQPTDEDSAMLVYDP